MFSQFAYQEEDAPMAEASAPREVVNLSDDGVAGTYAAFAGLTAEQKERILRGPKLRRFSDRLFAIWKWSLQFIGREGFVHHAPLVAAILGMAHTTRTDKHDFKRRVLEIEGREGVDWVSAPVVSIFPNVGNSADIEFPVPGGAVGQTVVIHKGGNAVKYPMLTEWFTRRLLVKKDREFAEFLLCVHDATLAEALGRRAQADTPASPPAQQFVGPATWEEKLAYDRGMAEIRAMRRENTLAWKELMESTLSRDDERGHLMVRDYIFNSFAMEQANERMEMDTVAVPTANAIQDDQAVALPNSGEDAFISHIDTASRVCGRRINGADASRFGRFLARKYQEEYGDRPPKAEQFVGGRICLVNQYRRRHIPFIERTATEFFTE